jgi:hypothetical protein
MKTPERCLCHVHTTADYSKYSRDAKLLRRCRLDSLQLAREYHGRAELETDPKERAWLKSVAICAEWSAWIDLLILREIKTVKPMEISR